MGVLSKANCICECYARQQAGLHVVRAAWTFSELGVHGLLVGVLHEAANRNESSDHVSAAWPVSLGARELHMGVLDKAASGITCCEYRS